MESAGNLQTGDFGIETHGFNVPDIYEAGYAEDALTDLTVELIAETE